MLKHQKLQKIQQELRKSLSLIHSSDLHSENELRIMVNNAKPEFDKKRKQIMKGAE